MRSSLPLPTSYHLYCKTDDEDLLNTKWHKHPKFPMYVGDEGYNRPGGRPVLFKYDIRIIRTRYPRANSCTICRDPLYNDGKEVILRPVQNNIWTYGQCVELSFEPLHLI